MSKKDALRNLRTYGKYMKAGESLEEAVARLGRQKDEARASAGKWKLQAFRHYAALLRFVRARLADIQPSALTAHYNDEESAPVDFVVGEFEDGIKFDCEAEGRMEKLGYLHKDRDMVSRWPEPMPERVNGHATKRVRRYIGPWVEVEDNANLPTQKDSMNG